MGKKTERVKYLFVGPGIIWVLLFTIFPLLYSLRLSFFHARLGRPQHFIWLENFGRAFTDYRFWSVLKVTIFFVGVDVLLTVLIGLVLALLVSRPLRKPLAHEGPVRIVQIPDFDCSACGGTHVQAAGEVGLIKITRSERRGSETRVEFLCGRRALADYGAKNATIMDLAAEFTVGHWEVADMVHRLAGDLKETRRELRRTRDALLDAEAETLWHQALPTGGMRLVKAYLAGRPPDDLKHLAQRLVARSQTVALLAAGEPGGKGYFTFARSADLDLHMGNLVRQACQVIGGGGGGRPAFAQGGGPQGERAAQALETVSQALGQDSHR